MSTQDQDPRLWLGARIRSLRAEKGWTQADLAERLGTSHQTVARSEAGLRAVGIEELLTLARTFGITMAEFVAPLDTAVMTGLVGHVANRVIGVADTQSDDELKAAARAMIADGIEGDIRALSAWSTSQARMVERLATEVNQVEQSMTETTGVLREVAARVGRIKEESQDGVDN